MPSDYTSLILLNVLCAVFGQHENGQQLISILVESENQKQLMNELQKQEELDIDFIDPISKRNGHVLALITNTSMPALRRMLEEQKTNFSIQTHLLERHSALAKERHSKQKEELKKPLTGAFDYSTYHILDQIYAHLKYLHLQYPERTELLRIGTSFEGREIIAMRIGANNSGEIVWIDAGIHAREWIAPAAALYFIKQLLTEVNSNLTKYNFYVLPVLNPDGYEYSWTNNRLWRKSRSKHGCTFTKCCYGVDLDRNFDFDFANNYYPCKSDYSGPKALSEPETKALSRFLQSRNSNVVLYVSMHSFGQYLLTPYGARSEDSVNHWPTMALGRHFAQASSINGRRYFLAKSYNIERKPGQAIDYVANSLDVPFAYALLLRPYDQESWNFELPENQIIPASVEAYEGLKNMVGAIERIRRRNDYREPRTSSNGKVLYA